MNKLEYLAIKVSEECNELAHEAAKIAIFGAHSKSPYNGHQNLANLEMEFSDLVTAMVMFHKEITGTDLIIDHTLYSQEHESKIEMYYPGTTTYCEET